MNQKPWCGSGALGQLAEHSEQSKICVSAMTFWPMPNAKSPMQGGRCAFQMLTSGWETVMKKQIWCDWNMHQNQYIYIYIHSIYYCIYRLMICSTPTTGILSRNQLQHDSRLAELSLIVKASSTLLNCEPWEASGRRCGDFGICGYAPKCVRPSRSLAISSMIYLLWVYYK